MNEKRFAYPAEDTFDLDDLLHPAQAFDHPSEVVDDQDLTLNEKRAILASWASDACAVETTSALQRSPGAARSVGFDDVMDALRSFDHQTKDKNCARRQRVLRRKRLNRKPDRPDPQHSLN